MTVLFPSHRIAHLLHLRDPSQQTEPAMMIYHKPGSQCSRSAHSKAESLINHPCHGDSANRHNTSCIYVSSQAARVEPAKHPSENSVRMTTDSSKRDLRGHLDVEGWCLFSLYFRSSKQVAGSNCDSTDTIHSVNKFLRGWWQDGTQYSIL